MILLPRRASVPRFRHRSTEAGSMAPLSDNSGNECDQPALNPIVNGRKGVPYQSNQPTVLHAHPFSSVSDPESVPRGL